MDIVERLNKIFADGIMAQDGDAAEVIAALKYYGFEICTAAELVRLRAEVERLTTALTSCVRAMRDVQDYWSDPGSYTHNALETPLLVHDEVILAALTADNKPVVWPLDPLNEDTEHNVDMRKAKRS